MERSIYLDYAATTPVDERVLDAMLPYLREHYGNPSSLYSLGRDAYRALEGAREQVATMIGAENPAEIIFTGCGTESDNAAIVGIATQAAPNGGHVIVSAFEHHAILEPAHYLEKHGFEVTYIQPDATGTITVESVRAAMRDDTVLVSIMHANNEIGTVQPIAEISKVVHAQKAFFHTDAAQTLGKVPIDVVSLGVDAMTFSGHKIYAPKGIGVLYLKRRTPFAPQLRGGGQEGKRRSGTQNVAGAVAFAKALEIMLEEMPTETVRLAALRDRILTSIPAALENAEPTAKSTDLLPNIAHLLLKGAEGEAMLLQLDNKGLAVSTGSACSSGSLEPSHVLLSIGCPPEIAHGSIRASLGRFTTEEDVDYFIETLPPIVERLRAMSPVYQKMFGNGA